jgi:hypothetical protein
MRGKFVFFVMPANSSTKTGLRAPVGGPMKGRDGLLLWQVPWG